MKRPFLLSSITLVFVMALLMIGCSEQSSTTPTISEELNLTSAYGGYDDSDEAPAFGDEMVAGLASPDPAYEDELLSTSAADSLEHVARQVILMNIRWGQLEFDSTSTTPTDWSGSLALKYGALRLYRPLKFERGQDEIVHPRPDRQTIEWVSQTTTHYDGVAIAIIIPPTPEGEDWSDNSLTFGTPPYTREFTIAELVELDEIVDVDDLGNQVAFLSRDLETIPCGGGTLDGKWVINGSGKRGHFFGRWMTEDGLQLGHLRGHFGTLGTGEQVFFGKYIGLDGRFRGFLRGTWGVTETDVLSDSAEELEGWFDGNWVGRGGAPEGDLSGQWSSVSDETDVGPVVGQGNGNANEHHRNPRQNPDFGSRDSVKGFFAGIWSTNCDGDAEGGDSEI